MQTSRFMMQFKLEADKAMNEAMAEVKAEMMGFAAAVVDDTPVLTGRLRGSWQFASSESQINDVMPPDLDGTTTKARLVQNLKRMPNHKDWEILFGTKIPWAYRVEFEGWSNKAPNGMVRKNIILGGRTYKAMYIGQFK